jgi:hypothetical protein
MPVSSRFGRAVMPLVVFLFSASLWGCTSDNPVITPDPNATPPPSLAPTGACALITTADAAVLLGEPMSAAYDNPGRVGTFRCTFANAQTPNLVGVNKVVVGIDESADATQNFLNGKSAASATPIAGLGDDAFATTGVTGDIQLNVLKGAKSMYIHLGTADVTYTPDQQAANLIALKALIAKVLPNL